MKRAREDNTVGIIQRAIRYLRIPVMKNTVKEALKSHSSYPTFKCICDTLNDWNIENYPLKYPTDEMLELKPPYIVHFADGGGQIGFVTKVENGTVTWFESYEFKRIIDTEKYLERCSGAVILLNPDKDSGEKDYRKKWQDELIGKAILPGFLFVFLLFIAHSLISNFVTGEASGDRVTMILYLTKIAGIILSLFLVLHEFEIRWSVTDKLCHLNKATNCNTVLNDKASKVFGWFGWADAGFIYFTGGLIFIVQITDGTGLPLLAAVSALTVPYPLFSVYYQGFVLKKWCPMCLGVQIILIGEFILLLPQFAALRFTYDILLRFVLTYLITGLIYALFILFKKEKSSNEIHYYKYLGFKKNPYVLRTLLMDQPHFEIPVTEKSLVFGNGGAALRITAFLSLHCSHCARAYDRIREILRNEEDVQINVVLMASDNKLLTLLYNYHTQGRDEESLKLLDQWFNGDPYSRTRIAEGLCEPEDSVILSKIGEENVRLFKECNVAGTPTFFVNGYKLPHQYDIDDIRYFREIFKGKEEALRHKDTAS